MARKEESSEVRFSVAAYFAELDEHATPFLTALGQVVVAVAALESNLRLELAPFYLQLRRESWQAGAKLSASRWRNSRP